MEEGISAVNVLLQTFRFDLALTRLRQVMAVPGE
jgi:hypothetical protein